MIGDAPGRGVEATAVKADLRVAVQAFAVTCGDSPAAVIAALDAWVRRVGRGATATVAYLTVRPSTGDLVLCTAGHCPPLVVAGGEARYLHDEFTPAVGCGPPAGRKVVRDHLGERDTLVLITDGLVQRPGRPLALGLLELTEHAVRGQSLGAVQPLDDPCASALQSLVDRRRRDDDLSVMAVRRTIPAATG